MLLMIALATTAQSKPTGFVDGYGYVDLGLSVKWATCNLGADAPEEYGDYYAWSEIETKYEFTAATSSSYGQTIVDFYDAATANMGSAWRTPTLREFQELLDNCKWTWTKVGDYYGYLVKSRRNGNSIFLPAAGTRVETQYANFGDWGHYWSSDQYQNDPTMAQGFNFYADNCTIVWTYRYYGRTIRPVTNNTDANEK